MQNVPPRAIKVNVLESRPGNSLLRKNVVHSLCGENLPVQYMPSGDLLAVK